MGSKLGMSSSNPLACLLEEGVGGVPTVLPFGLSTAADFPMLDMLLCVMSEYLKDGAQSVTLGPSVGSVKA